MNTLAVSKARIGSNYSRIVFAERPRQVRQKTKFTFTQKKHPCINTSTILPITKSSLMTPLPTLLLGEFFEGEAIFKVHQLRVRVKAMLKKITKKRPTKNIVWTNNLQSTLLTCPTAPFKSHLCIHQHV